MPVLDIIQILDCNPSESQESLICNFLISEAKKLTHFLYSFEFFTNMPVGRHWQFSPLLYMCNGTLFTNDVFFHITCITLSIVFYVFLAPSTMLAFKIFVQDNLLSSSRLQGPHILHSKAFLFLCLLLTYHFIIRNVKYNCIFLCKVCVFLSFFF